MCPSSLMTWSGTRCLSVLSIGHRSSMLGAVDHSVGPSPLTGSWPPSTHLRTRPCSCHRTTVEQTIAGSNPRKLTSTSPAVGHHQGVTRWQCVHSTMGARVDEGSHDGAIDHHSIDTWTSALSLSLRYGWWRGWTKWPRAHGEWPAQEGFDPPKMTCDRPIQMDSRRSSRLFSAQVVTKNEGPGLRHFKICAKAGDRAA
jgi:hypothetical protein